MIREADIDPEDFQHYLHVHKNIYGFKPYAPIFGDMEIFERIFAELVVDDFRKRFSYMMEPEHAGL